MVAWFSYLSIVLIWGSSYFAVVMSFESFSPFGSLALRFFGAALAALAMGVFRKESWPAKSEWWHLAVVGVIMLGVANIFSTWALQSIPSGLVAVFMSLVPLWITIFLLGQETPSLKTWLGLALGAFGVWLLLGSETLEVHDLGAVLAMFLAPVTWAFGTVYAKRRSASQSNFLRLSIVFGFASLVCALALPFFGGILIGPLTLHAVLGMVYLALIASLLANAIYFYLLKVWPAHRVGTFAYLAPVVAVLLGTLFLEEVLGVREVVGMGVVLLAVALTVSKCDE